MLTLKISAFLMQEAFNYESMMEDNKLINETNKWLYDTMQRDKSKNYPIDNELLANSLDVTKTLYLKMLGVILQQNNEINEPQQIFYKRIIAGANVNLEAVEYLRMAQQCDETDIQTFIEVCNDAFLKYRFILDSMLLCCLNVNRSEQYKLIVAFCEILKIEKKEVEFLASMAKAIVEINLLLYAEACCQRPTNIADRVFYDYFLILQSYLKDKENITIIQGFDFLNEPCEVFEASRGADNLVLINIDLSPITSSESSFSLTDKTKLLFSGCVITGNKHPLNIERCHNVKIINCRISNFNNRTICIEAIDNMLIKNCFFNNCHNTFSQPNSLGGNYYAGGVIYSKGKYNNGIIVIDGCRFVSCGTWNNKNATASPCISNVKCEVINSVFENCYCHTRNYGNTQYGQLFTDDSKEIDCKFFNSPKFKNYPNTPDTYMG